LAHGAASTALTVVHLVFATLTGAALGAYCTAWWFVLQLQCSVAQGAFAGCASPACPCAAAAACSAAELAAPGCAACEAPPAELCAAVHRQYNIYLLAFTGLAALLAALPALVLDVQVLTAGAARRGAAAARKQAMRVAVDQQTRLVLAGDKPTVTPGTLGDWVSSLLAAGDPVLGASAEKCRGALRARGFELPLRGGAHRPGSPGGKGGGALAPAAPAPAAPRVAELVGEGSAAGFGDLFDMAERGEGRSGGRGGGRRVKRQQVTPEQTPAAGTPLAGSASSG
jgi:hypothetical protein